MILLQKFLTWHFCRTFLLDTFGGRSVVHSSIITAPPRITHTDTFANTFWRPLQMHSRMRGALWRSQTQLLANTALPPNPQSETGKKVPRYSFHSDQERVNISDAAEALKAVYECAREATSPEAHQTWRSACTYIICTIRRAQQLLERDLEVDVFPPNSDVFTRPTGDPGTSALPLGSIAEAWEQEAQTSHPPQKIFREHREDELPKLLELLERSKFHPEICDDLQVPWLFSAWCSSSPFSCSMVALLVRCFDMPGALTFELSLMVPDVHRCGDCLVPTVSDDSNFVSPRSSSAILIRVGNALFNRNQGNQSYNSVNHQVSGKLCFLPSGRWSSQLACGSQ